MWNCKPPVSPKSRVFGFIFPSIILTSQFERCFLDRKDVISSFHSENSDPEFALPPSRHRAGWFRAGNGMLRGCAVLA